MAKAHSTANLEAKLHEEITKDARKNSISISEQIRRYRDLSLIIKNGVN